MAQGTPPAAPAPVAPATPGPAPTPPPSTPAAEVTPAAPAVPAEPAPAPVPGPGAPAAPPTDKPLPEAGTPPAEPAPAEPPAPTPTITGYIDTGYHLELNRNSVGAPAAFRAYDASGGFMLHAAHLAVAHSFTPEASAVVSLDFGSDAYINTGNYGIFASATPAGNAQPTLATPTGIPVDVREGYAKWTPGDFTLQAGKFVTLNGIEVVDGPLNPTLTRGFLFWLAEPVGHTGAKMQYAFGGGMAHLGVGLVNGWDRLIDNNNAKTILFNGDVIPSANFHAQISGSWGAENDDKHHRLLVDLTGGAVLDSLTLNFQALVGSESFEGAARDTWFGFGIQPVYVMDNFSLGGRLEYFNDKTGSRMGAGIQKASLFNFTITPGYMVAKGLTLRAEFRIDAALAAKDGDGNDQKKIFNGKSTQPTIGIGASYSF
jgi:hypothetical protein